MQRFSPGAVVPVWVRVSWWMFRSATTRGAWPSGHDNGGVGDRRVDLAVDRCGPGPAAGAFATGGGQDVGRVADGGGCVVAGGDHGHAGAPGAVAGGELRGRGLRPGVAGGCGLAQPGVDHVDAGGVDAEHEQVPRPGLTARSGGRCGDPVLGIEVANVAGGIDGDLHQLAGADPLAQYPGEAVAGLA